MSRCCGSDKNSNERLVCAECGNPGRPVKKITLEHLLKEDKVSLIKDIQYFFCLTPDCYIVYFSADKDVFRKEDLKVRVGVKEKEDPVPICYCFNYTKKMILDDLIKNGRSVIREFITKGTKTASCECEITNPQGSCCLGNVAQVIKEKK